MRGGGGYAAAKLTFLFVWVVGSIALMTGLGIGLQMCLG